LSTVFENAGRFSVHADEVRTAFLELQAAIYRQCEVWTKYEKSSLTIWAKPVGVGAVFQLLILVIERAGLLTHIAAMEGALSYAPTIGSARLLNWRGDTRVRGEFDLVMAAQKPRAW